MAKSDFTVGCPARGAPASSAEGRIVPRSRRRSTWGGGSARIEIAHWVTRRVQSPSGPPSGQSRMPSHGGTGHSTMASPAARWGRCPRRNPGGAWPDAEGRSLCLRPISPERVGVGVGTRDRRNERQGGHHGTQPCFHQATPVLGDDRLPRDLGHGFEDPQVRRSLAVSRGTSPGASTSNAIGVKARRRDLRRTPAEEQAAARRAATPTRGSVDTSSARLMNTDTKPC
jgi:hypothetical protein